jgi:A/G-specific adenine glycosylase
MQPIQWLRAVQPTRVQQSILRWYRKHGRSLPWRDNPDPYQVWLSEIMLQQTQVATVLGYFTRFLERFPTIAALAQAPEADVLHAWQGLGYYGRARRLHAAARAIVEGNQGQFPRDLAEIQKLPGLGRYTSQAIASFAFGQPVGVLEANTIRLWTRVCAADGDPAKSPLHGELWQLADQITPKSNAADFNQAVMDLGSMICTPRAPQCGQCPLADVCLANAQGATDQYPQLAAKRAIQAVDHASAVLRVGKRVLITQRPPDGVWANLWEFPRVERFAHEPWEGAALRALADATKTPAAIVGERLMLKHGIMHYSVRLKCFDARPASGSIRASTLERALAPRARWAAIQELEDYPFSSPQRRIARTLEA